MPHAYDMTQKGEKETTEEYHDRPLFGKPSITKVISRHAGTVLVHEPHVHLTKKEGREFEDAFNAVSKGSPTLPLSSFPTLLTHLSITLPKDLYCTLVDDNLHHVDLTPSADPKSPLTSPQCLKLYTHVYASPTKHGPRLRKACGRNDLSIVSSLLSRGCPINTSDGNGHTPMHHCTFYGLGKECIKLLAASSGKGTVGKLAIDAEDNRGWTPLMCAASNGFVDCVKALLDAKANVKLQNKEGRNVLHVAAGKGMEKIVKMLQGKGLVNVRNERGWTPIFDAALHEHEGVMEMLIKEGADLEVEDMLGYTVEKYCNPRIWERVKGRKKG